MQRIRSALSAHLSAVVFSAVWAVLAVFSYVIMIWDAKNGLFAFYPLDTQVVSGSPLPKLFITGLFLLGLLLIFLQEFKRFSLPALAVGCIFLFGLGYILLSPVQNGFDENAHFFKTLATLEGKLFDFDSYTFAISDSYILTRDHMHVLWYDALFSQPWSDSRTVVDGLTNGFLQCTYPPFGYLFCCLGCGLGILLKASAGTVVFLGRLFNLLGFSALVIAALKLIPDSRKEARIAVAFVCAIPGVIFNAAMITQDGVSFALVMILIALTLRLREEKSLPYLILFSALYLLVIPMRYPFIILGFLLLLVPKEHFPKGRKALWTVLLALLAVVFTAAYFFVISEQFGEIRVEGTNAKQQILYVLGHLPRFAVQSLSSFILEQPWLKMLILGNENGYVISTQLLYASGFLLLFFLLFILPGKAELRKAEKALIAGILVFGTFLIYFSLYCTYNPVGADGPVDGVQGRYFFPLLALLPLIAPEKPVFRERVLEKTGRWQLSPMFLLLFNLYAFASMMYFV